MEEDEEEEGRPVGTVGELVRGPIHRPEFAIWSYVFVSALAPLSCQLCRLKKPVLELSSMYSMESTLIPSTLGLPHSETNPSKKHARLQLL